MSCLSLGLVDHLRQHSPSTLNRPHPFPPLAQISDIILPPKRLRGAQQSFHENAVCKTLKPWQCTVDACSAYSYIGTCPRTKKHTYDITTGRQKVLVTPAQEDEPPRPTPRSSTTLPSSARPSLLPDWSGTTSLRGYHSVFASLKGAGIRRWDR